LDIDCTAAHYRLTLDPGEGTVLHLRLTDLAPAALAAPFGNDFEQIAQARLREADEFYDYVTPGSLDADGQGWWPSCRSSLAPPAPSSSCRETGKGCTATTTGLILT
jgi:hypothetical protein